VELKKYDAGFVREVVANKQVRVFRPSQSGKKLAVMFLAAPYTFSRTLFN